MHLWVGVIIEILLFCPPGPVAKGKAEKRRKHSRNEIENLSVGWNNSMLNKITELCPSWHRHYLNPGVVNFVGPGVTNWPGVFVGLCYSHKGW